MHPFYSYNVVTATKARDYLPSPRTVTAHVPQMLQSLCSCHKLNHEYNWQTLITSTIPMNSNTCRSRQPTCTPMRKQLLLNPSLLASPSHCQDRLLLPFSLLALTHTLSLFFSSPSLLFSLSSFFSLSSSTRALLSLFLSLEGPQNLSELERNWERLRDALSRAPLPPLYSMHGWPDR